MLKEFCPICKSPNIRFAWTYKEYKMFHCFLCDLQFAHLAKAGSLEYYQEHETYKNLYKEIKRGNIPSGHHAIATKIGDVAKQYLAPDKRRVVEFGCGSGYFLVDLKKKGFDCLGIDFNPEMIRIAKELFELNAKIASIEDLIMENARFDLVLLSHVLEHVEDPIGLMRKIGKILNPDGILLIVLPNRDFIRQKKSFIKGNLPFSNYPPHHLTFWSVKALYNAMKQADFTILECYAQTYPETYQTQHTFENRFKMRNHHLARLLAETASVCGRILSLQGVNIFGVGQLKK